MSHSLFRLRALESLPLPERSLRLLAGMFLIALVLRLIAIGLVPLIPEEAYYWMYAQNPQLSYYDHPPMVAWVIGLGTAIFGNTEFGVRIVGSLLLLGTSVFLYQFGRIWFGRRAAIFGALLLQILPVYFGVGAIATMDSALMFFWAMGLWAVSRALAENSRLAWYVAGVALGAAMLSKYTGVFLGVGGVLAVAIHRPWRKHLLSIHPYLAGAIALAMFSPVIIWNARNNWSSFRFQFLDRFSHESFNLGYIAMYGLWVLMILTPLLIITAGHLGARLIGAKRRILRPRWLIAAAFSAPLILVMAYKSIRYETHLNWLLPAFLSLMPAMCQQLLMMIRRGRMNQQARLAQQVAWNLGIFLAINIGILAYLVALQPRLGWIPAFGPWKQLATIVEDYEEKLENKTGREPLVIGDGKYRLASVLAFYRWPVEHGSSHFTTSQWLLHGKGLGYAYWIDAGRWQGSDCVYVSEDKRDWLANLHEKFESVDVVEDARLSRLSNGRYCIALCRGLRTAEAGAPAKGHF